MENRHRCRNSWPLCDSVGIDTTSTKHKMKHEDEPKKMAPLIININWMVLIILYSNNIDNVYVYVYY